MKDCKNVKTPAIIECTTADAPEQVDQKLYEVIVGALLYLCTSTRPDISAAVKYLSRHSGLSEKLHYTAVKSLICYLK